MAQIALGGDQSLTYSTETLQNLVNKDTDKDGILDWEENLWGTDPTVEDTDGDGTSDSEAIAKLKLENAAQSESTSGTGDAGGETLTKTDQFSRELLSTVATLSQNGEVDQATIDQLGESMAEQLKNHVVRKVFLSSELKISKDDSVQAVRNYDNAVNSIYAKHPTSRPVIEVFKDFVGDGENENSAVLVELAPINTQLRGIISDLLKLSVPQALASLHLEVINGLERLSENLDDVQLFDTDVIVALSAINQFDSNIDLLEESMTNLANTIQARLQ